MPKKVTEDIGHLLKLSGQEQQRLGTLLTKNNRGSLETAERQELQALVQKTEELALKNARMLDANHGPKSSMNREDG